MLAAAATRGPVGSAPMKFTYSSGARPLDGYTIKRGIGHGGFGEVYFAVSDGGKEVALKLLRGGNSDAELRGIGQCLNLKHPNLVSIYDLRTDAEGQRWVVMEYVAGETLGVVPFEGESAGEILMKHLTTPPDLSKLPAEFAPVVARALAKNPAHRFATMGELAQAVEAVRPAPAAPPPVIPVVPLARPVNPP